MDYIASLGHVTVITYPNKMKMAWGNIYGDKATYGNHPIADGRQIHTSAIKEIVEEGDEIYIVTQNSTYKVIGDIDYEGWN